MNDTGYCPQHLATRHRRVATQTETFFAWGMTAAATLSLTFGATIKFLGPAVRSFLAV